MTDLTWVLTSGALILAVIAIRAAFGGRLRPGLRCALWGLVLLRLLVPVQLFSAPWGLSAKLPERVTEQAVSMMPVEPTEQPSSAAVSSVPAGAALPDGRTQRTERNDETWTFPRSAEQQGVAALLRTVWLAGVGVTAAVFLLGNLRFALRLRRRRKPLAADCPLRVYAVENLSSSCLFGNAIYVAAETARDERRLHHVLAHELSHRRHGDRLWTLLRCAVLALHWYHPLVWWAAALARQDSELWADEGALRRLGEDEREPYGETLIALSAGRVGKASLLCTATAMTNGRRSLRERVTMLAHRPRMTAAVVAAVTLLAALAAGCAFAGAEPDAAENTPAAHGGAETAQTPDEGVRHSEEDTPSPEPSAALPRYAYQGKDPYLPAVCAWLVGEWEQQEAVFQTAITIPCPLIAEVDNANSQDIRIWGNFYGYCYQPRGVTLLCVSSGERPGLLHLRATDQGYTVFATEMVGGGTYYDRDMLRIFGVERMSKLKALDAEALRGQFIADYVRRNGLPFSQYQDFGRDPVPIPGAHAALTEEALEAWREALSSFQLEDTGSVTSTPVSCFFTSTYADPRDLDLAKFLAYCFPLAEPVEEEAEFETVVRGTLWEELVSSEDGSTRQRTLSDMPVPVHRYRVSRINELLTQYAGLTVDDLSTDWRHDGRTVYVPEYDAFYNFTSDFGPGVFEPRSGERSGDILTLRGDHTVLRLRVTDSGYQILSHLPIGAEATEAG